MLLDDSLMGDALMDALLWEGECPGIQRQKSRKSMFVMSVAGRTGDVAEYCRQCLSASFVGG